MLAGTGVVCAYALGQRLLQGPPDPPDPFEGTLLQEPLGYANGLGGLAAIGLAIAVSRLVFERRLRPLHGALTCIFVVTLWLTGSRGGWVAAIVSERRSPSRSVPGEPASRGSSPRQQR